MKFVAVESLLLAGLLLLSAYGLWSFVSLEEVQQYAWVQAWAERFPAYGSRELALAVPTCVVLYWGLHVLGAGNLAFWSMALLVVLPQGLTIWPHNQFAWFNFFGIEAGLDAVHPELWQAALFLASLVGLVVLYRLIGLRKLDRQLESQRADEADRKQVVTFEALMMSGLVGAGLPLAFLMVVGANALGKVEPLVDWSPWGVLTIGAGATVLLILTLVLWFRARVSPDTSRAEGVEASAREVSGARRTRPRRPPNK